MRNRCYFQSKLDFRVNLRYLWPMFRVLQKCHTTGAVSFAEYRAHEDVIRPKPASKIVIWFVRRHIQNVIRFLENDQQWATSSVYNLPFCHKLIAGPFHSGYIHHFTKIGILTFYLPVIKRKMLDDYKLIFTYYSNKWCRKFFETLCYSLHPHLVPTWSYCWF